MPEVQQSFSFLGEILCVSVCRIRRHSKSLDISAKVCGYCRAPFQLLYTKSMSSVPRTPNQFALFVKSNYASVQRSQPDLKHAGVMSVIKNQYQLSKSAKKPISFHLDDDDQWCAVMTCKLLQHWQVFELHPYNYVHRRQLDTLRSLV